MTWPQGLALLAVALICTLIALNVLGERRWAGELAMLRTGLAADGLDGRGGSAAPPSRCEVRDLAGLPPPVQRYFRAVMSDGQPIITAVTIDMTGRFNLSPTGEQWKPFTSHQRVVTRRPGFLWDARIAMYPGLGVRVVDSYLAGKGLLCAKVLGLFTMAEQQGEGDIARGELMRWFAEVPWYPTALWPGQGVSWSAVDEHSAKATLVDGPISLTLLFRFNQAGLIESFRADARCATVGKQQVMMPWEGNWSNYQWCAGVQVPMTGEVAWIRPEGRRSYFVGTVYRISLELAA